MKFHDLLEGDLWYTTIFPHHVLRRKIFSTARTRIAGGLYFLAVFALFGVAFTPERFGEDLEDY